MNMKQDFQFLHQLGEETRNLVDPLQIMSAVANLLGEYMQVSRCAYADVDDDEERFIIQQDYVKDCASVVGTYSLSLFGSDATSKMRSGQTLVIRDVGQELSVEDGGDMFSAIDIAAIICCPLIKENGLRAMMAVHQKVPRDWTEEEIELVQEVVERCWTTIEWARAEELARRNQKQFHDLFEFAPDAIVMTDAMGMMTLVNQQTETLFGYDRSELIGQPVEMLLPQNVKVKHIGLRQDYLRDAKPRAMGGERSALRGLKKDGTEFLVEISLSPIETEDGLMVAASVRDVTDRLALEEQLRQSQKMETVGQLAGGIAHDFNNLLTVINNASDLVLQDLEENDRRREELLAIRDAGMRAAGLTRQLLAFSRQQVLQPIVLNLNTVVERMEPMICRLIGEHIIVQVNLTTNLGYVFVDPTQIEQVLLNLAVNSRDAMPDGGTLTIETDNVALNDEAVVGFDGLRVGPHVRFSVMDTGEGIAEDVLDKMFDPFYSTKRQGHGTGLGLATVYGIVKQSGGDIIVESEVGKGTVFKIYFPCVDSPIQKEDNALSTDVSGGGEKICLVEDEDMVRSIAERLLKTCGYQVLAASSGQEALDIIKNETDDIDLLLTDVVMPDMNGAELAKHIRKICPNLKVLFSSGYTADIIGQHGVLDEDQYFIGKPYDLPALQKAIQEVLDT